MEIKIKESIIIKDGRIHEVFGRAFSLQDQDNGTLCELFKTKGFKRRKAFRERFEQHGHRLIARMLKKEGIDWKNWEVVRHGPTKNWSIIEKFQQYYEIVRTK